MNSKRYLLALLLLLFAFGSALHAQDDPEKPGDFVINYDDVVSATITNSAVFDWWGIEAQAGDVIYVQMVARDGLAPLIGILSPGGDLKVCSGGVVPNCGGDSVPDGTVEVEYTAEIAGKHRIVATRQGNLQGTTIGSYTLTVRRANAPNTVINPFQEVEFRCNDMLVTTAATITFAEDASQTEEYRISVYGLDGLQPVIRVYLEDIDFTDCSQDAKAMLLDSFTLPGEETRTVTDTENKLQAQLIIKDAPQVGFVTLTIGAEAGLPGRYMVVIEGFSIGSPGDVDSIEARLGPLAKDTEMFVYMVGSANSRLDPFMQLGTNDPFAEDQVLCDDAGRRGCEDVPAFTGAGVEFSDGAKVWGDQFDAGLRLAPGNPDPISLEFRSKNDNTHGDYAVVIIGELPPKS
jgi:hypothetical protein